MIAFFGLPFLWTVASALDRTSTGSLPWPGEFTLDHFRTLFNRMDAGNALRNSLIVSVATMSLATVTASLAGYGLSRLRYGCKTWVAYGMLLLQTIPLAATMVPIYELGRRLQLQNSYHGLVLAHAAVSLPFLVWLMKTFTDAVPLALEEEAWVDGASDLRAWFDVILPATLPGIAVVAGFAFVNAWSEVLLVVLLITESGRETLPFKFFYTADSGANTHVTAALGVLYVLPVLLLFLALRRLMIRGLVESTHGL
ncbi:MAG: carbohydrate ABC transporter permease [Thermomicrobiales bacterium]|nr:carbohydrate ABC transporter permease [Thermomicrobiales bacterium]